MEYISVPFSFKKDGYYYFTRRIPSDLLCHYSSKKITYSLRTKSVRVATNRALSAAAQLDDYWLNMRLQTAPVPKQHLAVSDPARNKIAKPSMADLGPKLSDAMKIYIKLKGHNRPKTFKSAAERACRYLISASGNKRLLEYTKSDATAFRDALIKRGMNGGSVSRVFCTIKAIITFAANESGVALVNPFLGVYFDSKAGVIARQPISVPDIRAIQKVCHQTDDDIRWLIALISDTGLRLAEAAGLSVGDFHMQDDGIPFVRVQPHPWRRLKNRGSARDVPLVGSSIWAAQRIIQDAGDNDFAFPRYNRSPTTSAGTASATLNKWLKQYVQSKGTMHGFRHSMRDRLRNVECPTEIADQIGGWTSSTGVGQSYGTGYSLEILHRWLEQAVR